MDLEPGVVPAPIELDDEYIDLDGPLMLGRDRTGGLRYVGSTVHPSDGGFWGWAA